MEQVSEIQSEEQVHVRQQSTHNPQDNVFTTVYVSQ
jgi:hypothetical protein